MRSGIRRCWVILGLVGAALLVGCDGSAKYVGTWTVDKAAAAEAMNEGIDERTEEFGAIGQALAREMTNQLVSGLNMTLEIERDGTWTMTGIVMEKEYVRSGRWTMDKGEIVMRGENVPEVRARIEGERLFVDRPNEELKLVFVKEAT